ncbi:MAG TPA: NAD-dependent epimerase/dehydratase family protein [Longimicrobiales bacterium]
MPHVVARPHLAFVVDEEAVPRPQVIEHGRGVYSPDVGASGGYPARRVDGVVDAPEVDHGRDVERIGSRHARNLAAARAGIQARRGRGVKGHRTVMRLFQIEGFRRQRKWEDGPLRVFVTGATGYLGSAVVREFVAAGHEVTGLTRWAEQTLDVKALGARAVVGDLTSTDTFRKVAAAHDVLIHAAADHTAKRVVADRGAVEALLWAVRQREREKGEPPRCVIYTSGCFSVGETGDAGADEDAPTDRAPEVVAWRSAHERAILAAATEAVATAVVRPGVLYGGGRGLIGDFFATAERDGAAAFVGDGANRWSAAYVGDVARLYRLIAERRARGIFHATEGAGTPVIELARAASRAAGRDGAVRATPADAARERLGGLVDALLLDQVVRSTRSERELGWRHEHPPFVESADAVYREWRESRAAAGA